MSFRIWRLGGISLPTPTIEKIIFLSSILINEILLSLKLDNVSRKSSGSLSYNDGNHFAVDTETITIGCYNLDKKRLLNTVFQ